jgi:hypothetical protein
MSLITNKDQLGIIDKLVADLEESIGVRHTKISFSELWDADPPEEAQGENFEVWMRDVSSISVIGGLGY